MSTTTNRETCVLTTIVPIILSGGAGSRLWPVSTLEKPKQFHALGGDETLFAAALARVRQGQNISFAAPIIICGAAHEPKCWKNYQQPINWMP
jgi:mannose-1-phosphate guanylyltransferase